MTEKKHDATDSQKRIIYVSGIFDEDLAEDTVKDMIDCEVEDPTKDIVLYIDSYGGMYDTFIALHDAMLISRCDVATVCVGKAMSAAQMLLISGTKGKRFITPHSRVMMHQISSGTFGTLSQMDNDLEQTKECQRMIEEMILKYTRIKKPMLRQMMTKDTYLTAKDCLDLGLVDHVITNPKDMYSRLRL